MADYLTTRPFPASISGRVSDLIPRHCRSVRIFESPNDRIAATGGEHLYRGEAHHSEIAELRRAIRIARREAETAHIR